MLCRNISMLQTSGNSAGPCKLRAQVFARFAGSDKNLVRRVFPCKALSWLDPFSI